MIVVLAGALGSGKDTIGDILVKNHGFRKYAFATPLKQMVKMAFPAFTDESLYGSSSLRSTQFKEYPITNCPFCGGELYEEPWDPLRWKNGSWVPSPAGTVMMRVCPEHGPAEDFVSPRLALQTLGTEWGRRLYSNVWVDAAFEYIKNTHERDFEKYGETFSGGSPTRTDLERKWVITDCRFKNEVEGSQKNGGIVVRLTRNMDANVTSHASETELKTIPLEKFDQVFDNAKIALPDLELEVHRMYVEIVEMMVERQKMGEKIA